MYRSFGTVTPKLLHVLPIWGFAMHIWYRNRNRKVIMPTARYRPQRKFHKSIPTRTKWLPFYRRHFSNTFSKMKMLEFRFKYHWNLVQLTKSQHWFKVEQATSYYLNQCWPRSLTHICGIRGYEVIRAGMVKPSILMPLVTIRQSAWRDFSFS